MDDIFDTPASTELIARISEIVVNLIAHVQQVRSLQIMFLLGMLDTSGERFSDFCQTYERTMNKMAQSLTWVEDTAKMTTKDAYDILYTVQDSIPMVVELEHTMSEMGAKIHDSDGGTLSEYLREAVKV